MTNIEEYARRRIKKAAEDLFKIMEELDEIEKLLRSE